MHSHGARARRKHAAICAALTCLSIDFSILQNLEGELGAFPVDTNLEGELSVFPVDTNLEGPLGAYPVSKDLVGILGGLPDEENLMEGELSTLPDEPNLMEGELGEFPVSKDLVGILGGLPDEPNLKEGELSTFPVSKDVVGILGGLPAEPNLKLGELGTLAEEKNLALGELGTVPEEANLELGELGSVKKGEVQSLQQTARHMRNGRLAGSEAARASKARKQSLMLLAPQRMLEMRRVMALRQQRAQRLRALMLLRLLKVEGQEVACGVAACNPDRGCVSSVFHSCLAEVKENPAKEKQLLDMHRAEVVKLLKEHKQTLAAKQLAAQQCVVKSCNEANGCNNQGFVGCVERQVSRARKVAMALRQRAVLQLRETLAARRAAFNRMTPEQQAAYRKAAAKFLEARKAEVAARAAVIAAGKAGRGSRHEAKKAAPATTDKAEHNSKADAKKPSDLEGDAKKPTPAKADAKTHGKVEMKKPTRAAYVGKGKTAKTADAKGHTQQEASAKAMHAHKTTKQAEKHKALVKGARQVAGSNELLGEHGLGWLLK